MNAPVLPEKLQGLCLRSGAHKNQAPTAAETAAATLECCIMEATAWFAGEPFSDRPACACPVLTEFLIGVNDRVSDAARQKLVPLIPKLVGSRRTAAVESKRALHLVDAFVRDIIPAMLDQIGEVEGAGEGWAEQATRLRSLEKIEDATTIRRSREVVASFAEFLKGCGDLARDLDLALDLARDLARALDRALDLARALALARALDRARALARALARARALDLDLESTVIDTVIVAVEGALEIAE